MNNSTGSKNKKSTGSFQPEGQSSAVPARPRGWAFISAQAFILRLLAAGLAVASLGACQGNVKPDMQHLFYGMNLSRVTTTHHQHLLASHLTKNRGDLHIYLEGDGRPWIKRFRIAPDPTPRSSLVLQLMRRDPHSSIYLSRPCYFNYPEQGLNDNACDSSQWTSARYSEDIVKSMVEAVREILLKHDYDRLILIGYSGGGSMAMLMAQHLPEVDSLVTLAANLDIDAWTRHHHYSPLSQSLNPADIQHPHPPLQYHFVGSKDTVVPPAINAPFLQRINQPLTVIDGFDHSCCWIKEWPALLKLVAP